MSPSAIVLLLPLAPFGLHITRLLARTEMPEVFGPSKQDKDYYDVPYKIMLPPRGVGANLLVPVALSASAVAYSSTRIESMFMAVGTAAGVAAQQLVDGSVAMVQDVDVAKVQAILISHFGQQIHVAQHAAPAHAPSWYVVTGAGSGSWNGHYNLVKAESAGFDSGSSPVYMQDSNQSHAIYRNLAGGWRIAVRGVALAYVASGVGSDGALPPLVGWSETEGGLGEVPAPTLVAGPPL